MITVVDAFGSIEGRARPQVGCCGMGNRVWLTSDHSPFLLSSEAEKKFEGGKACMMARIMVLTGCCKEDNTVVI